MNKAQQMQTAEQRLKKIEGHSIVSSKKKRKTFALSSNKHPSHVNTDIVELPENYQVMMKELNDACDKGDSTARY